MLNNRVGRDLELQHKNQLNTKAKMKALQDQDQEHLLKTNIFGKAKTKAYRDQDIKTNQNFIKVRTRVF